MKYFLIALLITALAALVFLPLGYMERDALAFGGEHIAIIFTGYIAFSVAVKKYHDDKEKDDWRK